MKRGVSWLSLLVSLVAVLVSLNLSKDSPESVEIASRRPVTSIPDISQCVDGGYSDSSCLEFWLTTGVTALGVRETLVEFDSFLKKYPDSIRNCHEPSHALGSSVWEARGEMSLRDLFSLGGQTCLMGYVHGILESLAQEEPSLEELSEVFDACRESYESSGAAQLCYDGIGHAAWSAYGDVDQSVAVCSAAKEAMDRRSCETGIIMQIFKPAHLEASRTLSDNMSEATDLCNEWPPRPTLDGSDPARGCWDGVAYLIHEKLSTLWYQEGAEDVSSNMDLWVERFKSASSVCADLRGGEGLCFQNLGRYVMLPWTGLNWDAAEAMCLTNSDHAIGCLWEAANGAMNQGVVPTGDIKEFLISEGHNPRDFKWNP